MRLPSFSNIFRLGVKELWSLVRDPTMLNPKIILVTDRIDLDDQISLAVLREYVEAAK